MVEISNCREPCFAKTATGCRISAEPCKGKCRFYKPKGCEDWIKREKDGEVWLIPPEEYFAKPAERK